MAQLRRAQKHEEISWQCSLVGNAEGQRPNVIQDKEREQCYVYYLFSEPHRPYHLRRENCILTHNKVSH